MEDDVNFEDNFSNKLNLILNELKNKNGIFVFLDRKNNFTRNDEYVNDILLKPGYSFWLNSYLINSKGAKKLIKTNFLERIIPVDEYVPMMYYKFNDIKKELGNRIYPDEFINNYNNYNKYEKLIAYSSINPKIYKI